jgi:hypothetical protein
MGVGGPGLASEEGVVEPVALLAPAPVPKKLLLFDSKYSGWTGNAPASALTCRCPPN